MMKLGLHLAATESGSIPTGLTSRRYIDAIFARSSSPYNTPTYIVGHMKGQAPEST